MQNKKRIISIALSLVMMLGMVSAASAASRTPNWNQVPNLTTYQCPFNVIAPYLKKEISFKVQGADSAWIPMPFPNSQYVNGLTTSWFDNEQLSVTKTSQNVGGSCVAKFSMQIPRNFAPGPHLLTVSNPINNTLDLGIAKNVLGYRTARNVSVKAYNGSVGGTLLASGTYQIEWDSYQPANNPFGNLRYPTAMDGVVKIASIVEDPQTAPDPPAGYEPNSYVKKLRINGTVYPAAGSYTYWQYRVYDSAGDVKPISERIGAGAMKLETGDQLIWVCAPFGYVFPTTIN